MPFSFNMLGNAWLKHLFSKLTQLKCTNEFKAGLPVPVAAQAQTSLPSKATGMVTACIGVGVLKFMALIAYQERCTKKHGQIFLIMKL